VSSFPDAILHTIFSPVFSHKPGESERNEQKEEACEKINEKELANMIPGEGK
jgi:hypothetical protein